MGDPIRNADGTVQVAPPTRSAFAPQPTQAPPPVQAAPQQGAGQGASPGFAGAILDAIKAIAGAVAPRAIVQRRQAVDGVVDQAAGAPPPGVNLGDHF